MTSSPQSTPATPPSDRAWLWLGLLWAILFVIRITAPANLLDQDQERPAAYVLDAVNNGHWLCQRDLFDDITSKPPLWTWLAAIPTALNGRINLFALYLPGALGALGVMWLLLAAGKKYFGARAAVFAAMAVVLSASGLKWMGLARTDGVFAFTVTATALLAWRAWNRGGGWTWFWLMAAVSTLAKGPLGLVLAAAGLLACRWECKSGEPLLLKGSQWSGIILFLLVAGGWFALAYWQQGQPLIDKMLGRELTSHMVSDHKGHLPGTLFWQPPLYYLSNAAPWSLFAVFGLWRIWKHPSTDPTERRFERFLFCWFAVGLFLFSMAAHQRADLLWPIMPAAALIAGRELARFTSRCRPGQICSATVAIALGGIAAATVFYFHIRAREPFVQKTGALKQLAATLEQTGGSEFPVTHLDSPMTLQFYLNTLRPRVSAARAAELLRGPEAAYVAVQDTAALDAARRPDDPPGFLLLPRGEDDAACPVHIVSNRPDFTTTNAVAFCFGNLNLRLHDARLLRATAGEFRFSPKGQNGEVIVTNESDTMQTVRLTSITDGGATEQKRTLAAHESWTAALGTSREK